MSATSGISIRSELLERAFATPEPQWVEIIEFLRTYFRADSVFLWGAHRNGGFELVASVSFAQFPGEMALRNGTQLLLEAFKVAATAQRSIIIEADALFSIPGLSAHPASQSFAAQVGDDGLYGLFVESGNPLAALVIGRSGCEARYQSADVVTLRAVEDLIVNALIRSRTLCELRGRAAALDYGTGSVTKGFALFDRFGQLLDSDEPGRIAVSLAGEEFLDAVRQLALAAPMQQNRDVEAQPIISTFQSGSIVTQLHARAMNGCLRVWCFFGATVSQERMIPTRGLCLPAGIRFTRREQEVLPFLAEGLDNNELARRLGISLFTTKDHLKSLFRKLNVRTRAEAIAVITTGMAPSRGRSDMTRS